jgi:SnoaL-like protein
MAGDTNRSVIGRYMDAWPGDYDALGELRHSEFVEEWPQSGERIAGHEAYRKIHENYPGGIPAVEPKRIIGSEDRLVLSPSFIPMRLEGRGDLYTVECVNKYPSGETFYVVVILEMRDGKVWRQRTYFAPSFEPPQWRSQWVTSPP